MWINWFPWRMVVRWSARQYGFLDPVLLMSRLQRFAQPTSVWVPTELLRSGAVLHARGLMNSQAIQHNMDWVWPYWVARQFNPNDEAFVPRAFSITHINMTHRNWTAVGLPDLEEFPIVDPRGLLTPFLDSWSLDAWLLTPEKRPLIPAQAPYADQQLEMNDSLAVVTQMEAEWGSLKTRSEVVREADKAVCRLEIEASAARQAWLVLALRPYNPEGVSFIHEIELLPGRTGWKVDRRHEARFDTIPDAHAFSHYRIGDVIHLLPTDDPAQSVRCDVGMATAAALFALEPDKRRHLSVDVPLGAAKKASAWKQALTDSVALRVPDSRAQQVYDASVRALILHSPGSVYPGPYTYRRFWFRDAAFILRALLCAGQAERVERVLDTFPSHQTPFGYFLSQDGEWDSNGAALWAMHQFLLLTGRPIKPSWWPAVHDAGRWIQRKRLKKNGSDSPYEGLLPAGFSAEHLGPNDYYYWDDFWSIAGLRAAAALADSFGEARVAAQEFRAESEDLLRSVEHSLQHTQQRLDRPGMPASPSRRLDAGAIGSLAAGYPLQIFDAQDERLLDTAEYLVDKHLLQGAFFQEISHSGLNPYLTLHIAQVLLRAGDPRALDLMEAVLKLASPTGQWPEAVHPRTGGGCMGDGQHVWASAEWVLMLRNCFVREEGDTLILCSGILPRWLLSGEPLSIRSAPTYFGAVSVEVLPSSRGPTVHWNGVWRGKQPNVEIRLPGYPPTRTEPGQTSVEFGEKAA